MKDVVKRTLPGPFAQHWRHHSSGLWLLRALTVEGFAGSDEAMIQARPVALILAMATTSLAFAETMSFESAAAMLGESCGKDIDTNCFGVNFDAPRLKECLARNQDAVSPQCRADYVRAFDAIQKRVVARAAVAQNCERDKQKFCADTQKGIADLLGCLSKVPRWVSAKCNKAIGEAGYR
jgi:hypothetical protein